MKHDPELVAFCRRHHARLVGLLALRTGRGDVAEELAQDVLVRLYERWPEVSRRGDPWPWVAAVAVNLSTSWWRRQSAERRANRRHSGGLRAVVTGPDPADTAAVREAVASLPDRQRSAVVLRYYATLTVAETAQAMGCAEGTVKALTHQAVTALRDSLAPSTNPLAALDARTLPEASHA